MVFEFFQPHETRWDIAIREAKRGGPLGRAALESLMNQALNRDWYQKKKEIHSEGLKEKK